MIFFHVFFLWESAAGWPRQVAARLGLLLSIGGIVHKGDYDISALRDYTLDKA
jgi:hypothetical protein